MWKCKCGEQNPDSSTFCQSCGAKKSSSAPVRVPTISEQRSRVIQQAHQSQEFIQKTNKESIKSLLDNGHDGYWEYKVLSLNDSRYGGIHPSEIAEQLNELGLQGWRLKCAFTNESGKNASSVSFGGISTGTNSTVDQNIFIFERFVKINPETL